MPDARPLTLEALESLLADAGHETFVSFVADLLAREGRDVRREGPVIVAEGPDRHRDRALVWTDESSLVVGAMFTGPDGLSNRTVSIDCSVYVGPPGAKSGWQRAPSGTKTSIGENN
jgi:hypothetical protein